MRSGGEKPHQVCKDQGEKAIVADNHSDSIAISGEAGVNRKPAMDPSRNQDSQKQGSVVSRRKLYLRGAPGGQIWWVSHRGRKKGFRESATTERRANEMRQAA